jgi:KUP system potassium uptake protein
LSLIFWSLLILVTLKYLLLLRADNAGEGGILSLVALIQQKLGRRSHAEGAVSLGVLGTALFFCDALITPAISVLSAVEGLELLQANLHRVILPITAGIIIGLFAIQSRGTEKVGRMFGPVMLIWFAVLGVLGAVAIAKSPAVLLAADPRHGLTLLVTHPVLALVVLGTCSWPSRAVRRSMPTWGISAVCRSGGLVRHRLARPVAQLLRPGALLAEQRARPYPSHSLN